MLTIDQGKCAGVDQSTRREWIVTNGLGGYASATISGANSRRYHGLLVAATDPPAGRSVLLSKLEETLIVTSKDGHVERIDFSMNVFGEGVVHPQGHERQTGFRLEPHPVFTYDVGGVRIEKQVFMVQGESTVVVEYAMTSRGAARGVVLEVRPLIAFKDFHSTKHEDGSMDLTVHQAPGHVHMKPYAHMPDLHLAHNADEVIEDGSWYRDFALEAEKERGLDWHEDLYHPLTFHAALTETKKFVVVASTETRTAAHVADYRRVGAAARISGAAHLSDDETVAKMGHPAGGAEMGHPAGGAKMGHPAGGAEMGQPAVAGRLGLAELTVVLERAAEQFIVARPPFKTVIAGYHWFGDWGRDTMISLPGLLLSTGQPEVCREILLEFNKYVDGGMLPNRFPDHGDAPEYNTVDATLWYFEALWKYVHYKPDAAWKREAMGLIETEFYPSLKGILALHFSGTRFGIHTDEQGFLWAGDNSTQLTWMDAKVGDVAITPRSGRPVEIQALWFNALLVMRDFAREFGEGGQAAQYAGVAMKLQTNFERVFWNEGEGCLYDVAGGDGWVDGAVRPNMAMAVSLTHCLLGRARVKSVLAMVEQDLLTPFGLRTLSPRDSRYKGRYGGDVWSRDSAYHQGTVWPWLAGPFFAAKLQFADDRAVVLREMEAWLEGFSVHFLDAGVGQVSEIFDGDAPWDPKGCIAQAWSVAELLRLAKLVAAG